MRGDKLDFWLSRGYYRMQQDLFTCRFVPFADTVYSVLWLRIVLANVQYGKDQRRLIRINEKFSVAVKPFRLSDELESLYAQYRSAVHFDAPDSVESCLLDGAAHNAFDTRVIEIRDENRLIAVGIFDNGARSIAGIMNFYHPDYRKQSLGKYLMLLKINDALMQKKLYYYPGYIVSNYPKFDYKLFPCQAATEVYKDTSGEWLAFSWETVATLSARMTDGNGPTPF